MMSCEKALQVLGEMEHPRPTHMPRGDYTEWLQVLTGAKFKYLVTAQVGIMTVRQKNSVIA